MIFPRLRSLTSTPGGKMRCGNVCDSSQVVFKWQTGTDLQCVFMFFILHNYGRGKWLWQMVGGYEAKACIHDRGAALTTLLVYKAISQIRLILAIGGGGKVIYSFRELLTQWRPGHACFLQGVFWLTLALEVWWYLHLRDLHKYRRCLHHLRRSNTNVAQRAKMCQVATRRFHNDNPCFEKVALAAEKGSRCEKQRLFRSSEAIPWWKVWKHRQTRQKLYILD